MGYIFAEKKGQRRKFTDVAWKLLGNNKNGWQEIPVQRVNNVSATPQRTANVKPNTGDAKTQKIENVVNDAPPAQKISNVKSEPEQPEAEPNKQEFFAAAAGLALGKTAIKEFFDTRTPAIAVSNRAGKDELLQQLGEVLNWDVVALNKFFK